MKWTKVLKKKRIQKRIRKKIKGSASKPRLAVYRSNKEIYCQLIDDVNGQTILATSTKESGLTLSGNKTERAKQVGMKLAEKAKSNNIESVVFDRGGYLYHGRVKALAEGAREGGLKF